MDEMDEVFKALADPSRRLLLDRLNARGGQSLRELCAGLDMARQSVSKHLAVLEAANLVTTVPRGRERLHYLNAAPINDIAERWINHYDQPRVQALADLKRALEHPTMQKPTFVYKTYIRTTPEQLWRALTDPSFTERYWGTSLESEWEVGSPVIWHHHGVTIAHPAQVVLEADPHRRLAYSWHTFTPEWAEVHGFDDEFLARVAGERRSRVSFEIEPLGEIVRLTVVHDDFDPGSIVAEMVSEGWPRLLSDLKTLLETGETLPPGPGATRAAGQPTRTEPADADGHAVEVIIAAPRDRVFEALTTLDGLAGWWTPAVTGSAEEGGEITFGFGEERIVMRVDRAVGPESVAWTCLVHTKFAEWEDTTLRFELSQHAGDSTRLEFRHVGLVPELECHAVCSRGWDQYVGSLAAHVSGDGGSPWGTPTWRPATT
jgi:uncharacterized protein YndB with AHSA1/START domain/DNA-binding transcriptional ArsR family regulator